MSLINTVINLASSQSAITLSLQFFNSSGVALGSIITTGFTGSNQIRYWAGDCPINEGYIEYYNIISPGVAIAAEPIPTNLILNTLNSKLPSNTSSLLSNLDAPISGISGGGGGSISFGGGVPNSTNRFEYRPDTDPF